ncbi:hypothetical protein [Arthrobacter mobilis]|uniref:Uncharacterized protein n=1 Tax=Arthrobacter mobilis TaxID=2724944 RepID=A0A7X6H9R0_9MICC|nr:hypothetical protein [Arthrobacter mobilis]NKX53066.1 hypothetical protein [Arthrobacter mobilis]
MEEELKQVWAASAVIETLQSEIDQAQTFLDEAIDVAVKAGAAPEEIGDAANLTPAELDERVQNISAEPV